MTANEMQIGGQHYKTKYEHWDLVIWTGMGYLEGCSTKYVSRWRKKDGLKDLQKALHYLDKLIETYAIYDINRLAPIDKIKEQVEKFTEANELSELEGTFVYYLSTYEMPEDLQEAREVLMFLIQQATEGIPGTPEDGGHHANQAP